MKIYLDNAATTPIDPAVADAMLPFINGNFGNPSSTHGHGREVKSALELSRKSIAERLNCLPGEIYFTSGGTEAINCILNGAVNDLGVKHAITSPTEHHAVLHTLEHLEQKGLIKLDLLDVDSSGNIDHAQLDELLGKNKNSMVSIMHSNNEIANVNDIQSISEICQNHDAFFHSDTVQAMGHFPLDMSKTMVDGVICSAHKIHGPKGVGFMFLRKGHKLNPFILGGGQERGLRGGTENIIGIAGLTKAFEIAIDELSTVKKKISDLKTRMIERLQNEVPDIMFNGDSGKEGSLYTVLNVNLPGAIRGDLLLFQLDLKGISASGGSACNSGALKGSHVLEAINVSEDRTCVRLSFSKYNTMEEIDFACDSLIEIINQPA